MKSTNTFTILFWINASRAKNGVANLYARVTVNHKRTNISLKQSIPVEKWDANRKRAKGSDIKSKQLNRYLDQTQSKLFQIYQDLLYQEEMVTAKIIKAKFSGNGEKLKSLINIIDYHEKKIKNTLAVGSIRNFAVTVGYVKNFLKTNKKTTDVYLKQLNYEFLCDFENYLSKVYPVGHPRAMSHNTIMKHIQRLRKIVTMAYHLEWTDRDPFVRWKPTFERTNREFLSEAELEKLENHDFNYDRLDRVRDLFVFSCYTGISYVDIMLLTPSNIVKGIDDADWIITKRKKTRTTVKLPLLNEAAALIQKYCQHPMTELTGTLLPVISNEKLNSYLKEVANHVGIKKHLTFHMARHTFATTITLSNGVPIETVSKLLGHTKIATTQIYARVLEQKVSQDMNLLKNLLNKKRVDD